MLAPFLTVFSVFIAFPLLHSLLLSAQQTFGPAHARFVGADNYRFLLADPLFWKAVRNTTVFALASVFIQLPLSLALAMLLNRPDIRCRALLRLAFFSPALVGTVFVALIFAILFDKRTGLVNVAMHYVTAPVSRIAEWVGGATGGPDVAARWAEAARWDLEFAWLQDHIMPALILASLWMWVGFNMVYFLAALQNVPKELVEASTVDGAGPWRRFTSVVVPAIRPVAGFVVLMSVIGSFQLFELPWILLNNTGGPDNRGLTVVTYLYQTGFESGDLGYASAIGWVLALLLVGCAIAQRLFARTSGAEEGA